MTARRNRIHHMPFAGHSERWHQERMAKVRAKRNPVVSAMYSTPQWRALRRQVLCDANYICASYRCPNRAVIADHIKPHRGHASLFFDRANLQALCKRHHDIKTARYDGGYGNPLREYQARSPGTGHPSAPGRALRGPEIVGGISGFSGARAPARLLSQLRTQPFQGNGVQGENGEAGNGSADARTARGARLTTRSGPPGTREPGPADANHPAGPGHPAIRNRVTRS